MKHTSSFFLIVSVALIGAGCSKPAPVTVETQQQSPDTIVEAYSTSTELVAVETSSTSPTQTDTQPMPTSDTLAFPGILPAAEIEGKFIHLKTTKGEIVFELLPKEGPKAASNFVYLAKQKFYDGLTFHRLVPDFVIQGGDPLGTGTGGPGYAFQDDPVKLPYNEGIVAMANAGPNTNGSQFFIMLKDTPLDPYYSVFGRVVKGMDVVHKLGTSDSMTTVTVESSK